MTRVPCRACQKRRKLLEAKLLAKKARGKTVQAAAIGAVLDVTGLVGKIMGEDDGRAEGSDGPDEAPSDGSREDRGQHGG